MKVDTRLFVRYVIRETLGIVVMAVALFWSAGRIDWWAAWAVLAVMAGWIVATAVVILRYNPDLLAERLGPRQGAKRWDVVIMSILGLSQLARYIVAGLDQRYGWTGGFPVATQVVAFILCGLGYVLVVWATAVNAYFSQIVRIQTERGQSVVMDGPYRYVRHPAYAGAILYECAVPVLLASWWAFIPSLLNAILLTLRTAMEDRLLQSELKGYSDYAHQVHARLLPGIW
jgi:protein-S-isoprenylcysteine O-methyltransferase Ste14